MAWKLQVFTDFDAFYAAGAPIGGVVRVRMKAERLNQCGHRRLGKLLDESDLAPSFWVAVPSIDAKGYDWFCPDMAYRDEQVGWTVAGELPNVTISPSIHMPGSYHGYIQNGVVCDDIDGRRYG